MNLAKFFIYLTFLFHFALNVSAQTSQIVWKNLQKEYERVEDIKPIIVNEGINSVFVPSTFNLVSILRFNESTKEWEKREPYLCGYGVARITTVKLHSKRKIAVDFYKQTISEMGYSEFMPPLEPQSLLRSKYKLRFYYGLKKSEINLVSDSPEFEVIEYNHSSTSESKWL